MKNAALLLLMAAISLSYTIPQKNGKQHHALLWEGDAADTSRAQVKEAVFIGAANATRKPRNPAAVASLVFDGLALISIFPNIGFAFLAGLAGIAFGIVGLARVRKEEVPRSSKKAAWLGLIFGVVVTALTVIIFQAMIIYH